MSGNDNLRARVPDRAQRAGDTEELRSGVGSASAMERMKADRAVRHKHQHGIPTGLTSEEEESARG
jgi:hypothetical protein